MGVDLSQGRFDTHTDLLRHFLTQREEIVARIEALLNAQRRPARSPSAQDFESCFVTAAASLRAELEETHWTAGFRPRQVEHLYNNLIDPTEMMLRGVHCWQQTWWPGRGARVHYAHTLFNVYVLRWLQFLSMRIWDDSPNSAGARLAEMQDVLDELWRSSPPHQPALVRDARWLIPLALSLITDELAPYFEVSRQITDTLPPEDVLEIQKAYVRMLGGHLTSQIRYYCTKDDLSLNDHSVILRTRTSNALDLALLVQGLVGLLKAYDRALQTGDERTRLDMAGAIYQGISPDPELFLNCIDLLSAYSMIEHVFIGPDRAYTPSGARHVALLKEYAALMHRLTPALRDDLPRFKPVVGAYSPYGVIFGLPSTLIEHMALKAIQHDAGTRFSLEDVFDDARETKLAWVNGWRDLPHIPSEVRLLYDYPHQFAEEIYNRIEHEFTPHDSQSGHLYIVPPDNPASTIPELPPQYFVSCDSQVAAQLLRDRQEGHFLVSYQTPEGWTALKKSLLTEVLGTGRDAKITGLPPDAAEVLRLMSPYSHR
jgi:hypothetical protein